MNSVRLISRYRTLRPNFVEKFHKCIIDHEGDGNIKANAAQTRNCPFVKPIDRGKN